ncbi:MAG: pyruvate, phosphate dikinase [Candidatus Omnitrophota bacterium]
MAKKYIYFFGEGQTEGKAEMKKLLGGKGANLAEMTNIGIPVPPGFTISTEACIYYQDNKKNPELLSQEIDKNLKKLEKSLGKKFGDNLNPLLVSVRSGSAVSMPGMMDTILNLGLNDDAVKGLIENSGNERFAYDAYRRFIQMFGNVVLEIEHKSFEKILEHKKESLGVSLDTELDAAALKSLVGEYKELVKKETGKKFPDDPRKQLDMAVIAVFKSWNNKRAITYRKLNNIPHDLGTAVNVQAMVFGNMGDDSGTGVAFTRNPSTGEKKFYGEYLMNAQGEDVVAGIRTPLPINDLKRQNSKIYDQLMKIQNKLEKHYKDMQDLEFTIEKGKLYLLQTRNGKRTAASAIKVAVDMVNEKLISKQQAVLRVQPEQLDRLLHPMIDPKQDLEVVAKGLPASPGAAVGKVVFNSEEAEELVKNGEKVVLVRAETSPEDISGMAASEGILTARGGMTSHAAVVGRGMGKCAVVGCTALRIDESNDEFTVAGKVVKRGDWISLNGSTGEVIIGKAKLLQPQITVDFKKLMQWADEVKKLKVRANADTPKDAEQALEFGAEGIGLCRTEHMFFGEDRLLKVRRMILAQNTEEREQALKELLPLQKSDFKGIFKVMGSHPVTIRLLDPPLHEFLPHTPEEIKEVAKDLNIDEKDLAHTVETLKETNPMLGHRGCRLGVTYPEIYRMQARAIIEAACELSKGQKKKIKPEIMIPLIGALNELKYVKKDIEEEIKKVLKEKGVKIDYSIGTMIEIPRAALTADEIATEAEFFSFGTNDLTQLTFGFSRDDIAKFLPFYIEHNILEIDPFMALDKTGVGQLVEMGVKKGRSVKKDLKVGICGEHGGDPSSVKFCHKVGLDYVSCSPFRVPIARLAAAHAALEK